MDENMMNERMWAFMKAHKSAEMGYPWVLYMAEQGDSVPVPLYGELYRGLWSALKKADASFDLPEEACVPDPAEGAGWMFTTNVNAVKGPHVVAFAAKQLKKADICNPDALPESPKCKEKSWAVLLDDVYQKEQHYEFAVDEKCFASLADKGYICIRKTMKEAKERDAAWREEMPKVCCAEYLNKLYMLAETEAEKIYVRGQAAKAMMLRRTDPGLLVEALKAPKN